VSKNINNSNTNMKCSWNVR